MKTEKKLYLILSALLGIVPFLWNLQGILVSEEYYAVDYVQWGKLVVSSWVSYENFGWFGMWAPFRMQGYIIGFFELILRNYKLALLLWNTGLWSATAVFFYLCVDALFKGQRNKFALFLATIYYTFSPFFLNIHFLLSPPRLIFVAMPFFLWLLLKTNNVLYLAIISILFSPIFMNIPVGVVLCIYLTVIITFHYYSKGSTLFQIIQKLLIFFVLFGLVNLWWIIPDGLRILDTVSNVRNAASRFSAVSSTHISDVYSLFGSWAFREKYNSRDYYFPYNLKYDAFPLVFLRYLPFVLILYGLYNKIRKKDKDMFFLLAFLMYLLFFILSKGTNGLFGFLYQFFLDYVPGFWMFREPYAKFTPVLAFYSSILMMYGLTFILDFVKDNIKAKIITYSIVVMLFFYISFPFFNIQENVKNIVYNEPNYLTDFFSSWNPHTGNYLQMPSSGTNFQYKWDKLHSGNPYILREDLKIIFRPSIYENPNIKNIALYLFDIAMKNPSKFLAQLQHYNISGIIYQNDNYNTSQNEILTLKENYINYLTITTQAASVYEFSTPILNFKLIDKNNILKTRDEFMDYYHELRELVDAGEYLVFNNINGVDRRIDKIDPTLINLPANSYTFNIEASRKGNIHVMSDTLEAISVNNKKYKSSQTVFPISTVGKEFNLIVNNIKDVKEPIDSAWESMFSEADKIEIQSEKDKEFIFVKKLNYLNTPSHIYVSVADRLSTENFKIGIYYGNSSANNFTQVDKKDFNPTIINNQIILDLDISTIDIERYKPGNFYIFVKTKNPELSDMDLRRSLNYNVVEIPSVWFVSEGANLSNTETFEEKKINDYTYFVKLNNKIIKSETFLLLSQGYSKYWRLVPVNSSYDISCFKQCSIIARIKNDLYIFRNIKGSAHSTNVEYIYNGWDLDEVASTDNIAIFYPAFISIIFLKAQLYLIGLLSVFILVRNKIIYKKWL